MLFKNKTSIFYGKRPMNLTFNIVAVLLPSQQLPLQSPFIRQPTLPVLATQNTEFNFSHVKPRAVSRGEVNAQPIPYPVHSVRFCFLPALGSTNKKRLGVPFRLYS